MRGQSVTFIHILSTERHRCGIEAKDLNPIGFFKKSTKFSADPQNHCAELLEQERMWKRTGGILILDSHRL
ncbi:hypothetical protein ASD31_21180 [Rhizobium sp. Root482]|nr:hypothetical protein ASD31_21180 [Rhizobium sp. Root482]